MEYALTEIPARKLYLGIPNYGYDWPLPYEKGKTRARSISNQHAVELAVAHRAEIQYDETVQTPWFRYTSSDGQAHEVWFEDARSMAARRSVSSNSRKPPARERRGFPVENREREKKRDIISDSDIISQFPKEVNGVFPSFTESSKTVQKPAIIPS